MDDLARVVERINLNLCLTNAGDVWTDGAQTWLGGPQEPPCGMRRATIEDLLDLSHTSVTLDERNRVLGGRIVTEDDGATVTLDVDQGTICATRDGEAVSVPMYAGTRCGLSRALRERHRDLYRPRR